VIFKAPLEDGVAVRSFALSMKDNSKIFQVEKISEKRRVKEDTFIIAEKPVTLFLNDLEVVTLLATPENLKELAVGFMLSEGLLRENRPIERVEVDPEGEVRVRTKYPNPLAEKLLLRRTITSGCGRGTIFYNVLDSLGAKRITSAAKISPGQVFLLMKELNQRSILYRKSGSVHGAALADKKQILAFCEDIGRHNAVDKVFGASFLQGFSPAGKILLTSGRISSEILVKAVKRRIPFLFSYSGPTDLAVEMARQTGLTLVGYVRGNRMRIYSRGERVAC
jgi:FdhD protein